jgi:glycosyltransferase involved in cell wall biosynthesis
MIAARMAGLPFSFTLHGPAELFDPEGWHLGEKVARARFTLCISHYARAQAMLFSDRAHWPRIRIVHCGVEPARYATTPPPARDGLHLLFVGRLTAIKGVFVLLDAVAAAAVPGLRLTLIGDGEDRAALEARAAELRLDATFAGYASQSGVAEAVTQADALVLPSFAEGVPVVLMEAMAGARPVICTQVGGVSELVGDGDTGLVVPPGDAAALAGAIRRLAAMSPDARAAMGARGRALVAAEFDVDGEASRIAALLTGTGGDALRVL